MLLSEKLKNKHRRRPEKKQQIVRAPSPKQPASNTPPLPPKDPGFVNFCKYFSYPAYSGLFEWQKRHHDLTWPAKFEKTLVHRKSGKSVVYNNKYQWAIQYQDMDVLLLGWTSRYKEIAVYVYNFFEFYGQIDKDKRTSPFHFRTKNGGSFDCYLITSKETLGKHSEGLQDRYDKMSDDDWEEYKSLFEVDIDVDAERIFTEQELKDFVASRKGNERKLWIAIDDPIDISFRKERHKEETLELHFAATLYGIQPDKWSFTGTRKFEGDFFDYIDITFGAEPDYVGYVRGIWEDEAKGELLCPEMFTHPKLPSYEQDLKDGKEDLARVRKHVGEYVWWSDYMQEPKVITGGIWKVEVVSDIETPPVKSYDCILIGIDRATTKGKDSDYTGCVEVWHHVVNESRLITHDYTDKISLEDLLILINDRVIEIRNSYSRMEIRIIVEQQGGGDDFIENALNRIEFTKIGSDVNGVKKLIRIPNKIREYAIIIPVSNRGEKYGRIKDRLHAPVMNKRLQILRNLKGSEVYKELGDFDGNTPLVNDDALDALANIEHELMIHPIRVTLYKQLTEELKGKKDTKRDTEYVFDPAPLPELERLRKKGRDNHVFR